MRSKAESAPYQMFMLALCAYALLALLVEVVVQPSLETRAVLAYADAGVCLVFLADFFLSLWRAANRWRYLYTWGWLDLLSSIPALDVARWGRVARVARLVKILRGVRATKTLGQLVLNRRAESTFLAASLIGLLLIVMASISILQVETSEQSNIKGAGDAIWWAMSTITTVGYGDRYPVTPEGRVVAGLLMSAGVGLFGMVSGLLAAWFVGPTTARERSEIEALRDEIRHVRSLLEDQVLKRQ